jgi:hypothetical protein
VQVAQQTLPHNRLAVLLTLVLLLRVVVVLVALALMVVGLVL